MLLFQRFDLGMSLALAILMTSLRYFRFMTGASQYRLKAHSREEVLRVVQAELCPDPDMLCVIESTLYAEEEVLPFLADSDS
jgi:hypothetical protein